MKRLSFLALLSAQVCFAGTPLSNENRELAPKATTVVVTSKTSADATSAVQDKRVNPFEVLPQELMHEIFYQIMGTPMIPAYVGPDGKRRPVYSLEQHAEALPFASTSRDAYRCLQNLSVRWIEKVSLEDFEHSGAQNKLSTNPLHCYDVKLRAHILADEVEAILSQANAPGQPYVPALTLASRLDGLGRNLEHFASWKETLNAHAKIRSKSLHIKLPASKLSDFFSPKFEVVRTFFNDVQLAACLGKYDSTDLQEVCVHLPTTQRRMIVEIQHTGHRPLEVDLATFPYVKTLKGAFTLAPLSGHTSIEEIIGFRPPIVQQIENCPNLRALSCGYSQEVQSGDQPVIQIRNCENLRKIDLRFVGTNADFQIEGCPNASVIVSRSVSFFASEGGKERLLRCAKQARFMEFLVSDQKEVGILTHLLQANRASLKKNVLNIFSAGLLALGKDLLTHVNSVSAYGSFAKEGLIDLPDLIEAVMKTDHVANCASLQHCTTFPLEKSAEDFTVPLVVTDCNQLNTLHLADNLGAEVRDCAALKKIVYLVYTVQKEGSGFAEPIFTYPLKLINLPALEKLSCSAYKTPLVHLQSCTKLEKCTFETTGWVSLDRCSKFSELGFKPTNVECPRGIIALDTPLCELVPQSGGNFKFVKTLITNHIDQKLPGYLARAIEAGVVQQHDMALMIYVLSPRGTKAMRAALESVSPKATLDDVDGAIHSVLNGKGNLHSKSHRP